MDPSGFYPTLFPGGQRSHAVQVNCPPPVEGLPGTGTIVVGVAASDPAVDPDTANDQAEYGVYQDV